jgi:hypothetical protein
MTRVSRQWNFGRNRAASLLVALVVCASAALARDVQAQGFIVTGYGDLEWTLEQRGTDEDGNVVWHHFFDNHHMNLIFLGSLLDDLLVGAEIEYEHAGEEIAVEYAYLAYTGLKNVRLVGGKFIIPFNRWNKDVHPTWISKMPGRPLTYVNVFPSTYSDVGLWVSGGVPVGSGSRVVYDAYVINGLEGEADASNWRGFRGNDRDRPRRGNDKAIGGRLGIELASNLGLGVSAYTGEYAEDEATEDGLRLSYFGADVDYRYEGLELRGELIVGSQDLSVAGAVEAGGDKNDRTGFYAQAAYLFDRVEPVVRYSWVNFEEDSSDTQELGLGFNWYFSTSAAIRIAYFLNSERGGEEFERDNDKLMTQFTVVF